MNKKIIFLYLITVFIFTEIILRIIQPSSLEFYRKQKQIHRYDENYFIDLSKTSQVETPEQNLAVKEIISKINALSDEYRIPFQMHYNGFKYKEIADKLGLPIGTIKSRIFLARQKLSEVLVDHRI